MLVTDLGLVTRDQVCLCVPGVRGQGPVMPPHTEHADRQHPGVVQQLPGEVGHSRSEGGAARQVHRVTRAPVTKVLILPEIEACFWFQKVLPASLHHHRLDKVRIGDDLKVFHKQGVGKISS